MAAARRVMAAARRVMAAARRVMAAARRAKPSASAGLAAACDFRTGRSRVVHAASP
jgi:hypothetical protein